MIPVQMKEIIEATSMTMKEFAEYFSIPYRTLQNWCNGDRKPPKYLIELILYKLKNEKKI